MMTQAEIMSEFRSAGALIDGHFVLSSGLHSAQFLQCARIFADPRRAERLCAALAAKARERGLLENVSTIISPALGGIIAGYEMGRQLGLPALFFERVNGVFTLRRGLEIEPGQGCMVVEDVVTTGLSLKECAASAKALGGKVLSAAALADRSGGKAGLDGLPFVSLLELDIKNYPPDQLPDALKNIPPVKPGSRPPKG